MVSNSQAESELATRLEVPANELGRYKLPMQWGVYSIDGKKSMLARTINTADVLGPGYHWYKLGETALSGSNYLYLTWS